LQDHPSLERDAADLESGGIVLRMSDGFTVQLLDAVAIGMFSAAMVTSAWSVMALPLGPEPGGDADAGVLAPALPVRRVRHTRAVDDHGAVLLAGDLGCSWPREQSYLGHARLPSSRPTNRASTRVPYQTTWRDTIAFTTPYRAVSTGHQRDAGVEQPRPSAKT
jgi:hypothetical protein